MKAQNCLANILDFGLIWQMGATSQKSTALQVNYLQREKGRKGKNGSVISRDNGQVLDPTNLSLL